MTRPTLTAVTAVVAVVVAGLAYRRRHELRTLAWAVTGWPRSEARWRG